MDTKRFAAEWIAAWNARDLETILSHYADDVEFTTPIAARVVPESGGVVKGREALRAYWSKALPLNPDLHFDLIEALDTVRGVAILYRNHRGQIVSEVLFFDERDLVVRASAAYGAVPAPAPTRIHVLVARVPPSGIEAFNRYEDSVLPLLDAHGARLERRLRSADKCTEVHLVRFPTDEAFAAFQADPRRAALRALLASSAAATELLELEDVGPKPLSLST